MIAWLLIIATELRELVLDVHHNQLGFTVLKLLRLLAASDRALGIETHFPKLKVLELWPYESDCVITIPIPGHLEELKVGGGQNCIVLDFCTANFADGELTPLKKLVVEDTETAYGDVADLVRTGKLANLEELRVCEFWPWSEPGRDAHRSGVPPAQGSAGGCVSGMT